MSSLIDTQTIWILVHVLFLVYWLGGDISVFYIANQIKNQKNTETRLALVKIINFVNWFPNISNVFIFPVGLMLLGGLGYFTLNSYLIFLIWSPFILWFFILCGSLTQRGNALGKIYYLIDNLIRLSLIFTIFIIVSILYYYDLIFIEGWVLLKLYLYGYILICGIGIRTSFSQFPSIIKALIIEDSNERIEGEIKRLLSRVKPWVLSLWLGLILISFIGISKLGF